MWWFGTFLLDFYLNCFVFPFCILLLLFQPYINQPPLGCLSYTHTHTQSMHLCFLLSCSFFALISLFSFCPHFLPLLGFAFIYLVISGYGEWLNNTFSSSISFIFIHFVIWFFIAEIVMRWFFFPSHTYVVIVFFLHEFETISSMKQNEFLLVQHPQK